MPLSPIQDIFSAIKEKRAALERLQKEIAILESAVSLLEGDTSGATGTIPAPDPAEERLYGAERKGHFSSKSIVGMTIQVLKDAGSPLHASEIAKRLEQRGRRVNKASLVGAISRLVNEQRVFVRRKPNVFGLIEWMPADSTSASFPGQNAGSKSAEPQQSGSVPTSNIGAGWAARH